MNPQVDAYIRRAQRWPAEMATLRAILVGCGLHEEIKWGKPCYGHGGRNIAIMQEMKDFLALMFFKGALLNDPDGVLEEQGPNSRSARRIRFTTVDDVTRLSDTVRACIAEAIDVEEAGLDVGPAPQLVRRRRAAPSPRGGPEAAGRVRGAHPGQAAGVQPVLLGCEDRPRPARRVSTSTSPRSWTARASATADDRRSA